MIRTGVKNRSILTARAFFGWCHSFFFLNIPWLLLWYFLINYVSTVRGRCHLQKNFKRIAFWKVIRTYCLQGHTQKKSSLFKNVLPSKSRYKVLSFIKHIFYYSLLFSVQMIQERIWVLLVIIYSCPTNIPCECISDYRWFMNYSTIFDYMLLSRLWLTFTKQTAVVAKTLLPLLPHPSCLLLTFCQKFLLLFQIQQNLLHLSCSSS